MLSLLLVAMMAAQPAPASPGRGIPETLARERAAAISGLHYELSFQIPADRRAPVRGRMTARFRLASPQRLVFDFAQPRERIDTVAVDGRPVAFTAVDGHIVIAPDVTHAGEVSATIEFDAGDDALNRNDDFLYTLFVPARAHLTFPCFDQPDLKARYSLTLDLPADWQAVANGAERSAGGTAAAVAGDPSSSGAPATRRIAFAETQPLPTYLFAFAAGKFSVETATRNGRPFRMFHRETDAAKVARNRDAIFDLHASALTWLERYTNIPYPFGKFDFVLIPSFQFGGMEHAGAILYNASGLMLDQSATQNQLLERASVIAHETAHMWFGDLVTMKWFNDVWMKEVFANFMAGKIVNPSFPQVNHDLRFLLSNYPAAYQVDRTAGTNPIRQPLANLDEAGQLYGAIIYQKAPIVMRQLETIMGERAFRDGLREYLARYRFGNATWLDLVAILDARTPENLAAWSQAWVEQRGRPEFTTAVSYDAHGRLAGVALAATDPHQRGLVWPQRLRVTLGYHGRTRDLPVSVTARETEVRGAKGQERPLYILPNGGGLGYGLFTLDEASLAWLTAHVEEVPDALTRGSAWITLWDNVLVARMAPAAFLDTAMRALPSEPDEQNAQRVLGYVTRAFWRFVTPAERQARADALERALREGLARAPLGSRKAAWFNALRDTALTTPTLTWLERVWRREEKVDGLPLAETDEIALALELAVREVPAWDAVLRAQLERTQNPDRKARFAFVMPALSADPGVREQAFARFREVANRRREPWVLESLQYLNHPLREAHARQFVGPALNLLREIQRTGDIFFPTRWTESTLWGHRSPEVAATVQGFLAQELQYPQRLRWTVLSAADELFRAAAP